MNFIEQESPEKLRGGYYTPADIAAWLVRWVAEAQPRRLLEPSAGDGAFLRAVAATGLPDLRELTAFELDPAEAARAREAARDLRGVEADVRAEDFLAWAAGALAQGLHFDACVGNPPFIRYQYLPETLQARAEALIRGLGLPFTKHTNAWVPFVIAALALLRPGGRLAMVVPSELLHVLHAQPARTFLLAQCARVLLLDPEEIWFEGTLQGVVLLLAEKKGEGSDARPAEVGILPVRGRGFLLRPPAEVLAGLEATPGAALRGKWMRALLGPRARRLLAEVERHPGTRRFAELAEASVGIVTGANDFFLVPEAVVEAHDLRPWAHPMFGRSEHVPGVIYDEDVHAHNQRTGQPTCFLWFHGIAREDLPAGAARYVAQGEAAGLHRRFKCRVRTPWFEVPSVSAAPVALLKRSHDLPRLVHNRLGAFTTDTAYRVRPRAVEAERLVAAFVNSLTALSAELEGRHYGGGVLELVPSEIARLLLPASTGVAPDLARLDGAFRRSEPAERILARRDPLVLAGLGLASHERDLLRESWQRLRARRQRRQP
ncbi:MAG: N-6 DNA methylase [Pseudomonadota bacterium]